MGGAYSPTPEPGHLDQHDINVIIFHVAVAAIQAVLITFGSYSVMFGSYGPYVTLYVQVASEFIRRLVV